MSEKGKARAEDVGRAIDELLTRLARAAVADARKKRAANRATSRGSQSRAESLDAPFASANFEGAEPETIECWQGRNPSRWTTDARGRLYSA